MKNMKNYMTFGIALVCAMLFTACSDVFKPVESGYGRVGISLGEDEARTVLPSTVFNKYVYTFTKSGETAGTVKTPDSDGLFTLEVGSYIVEVQAFIGNAEPYTLAASGVSSQFNLYSGNNAPVEVRLTVVTTGVEGTFTYLINYPSGADTVISLQKWPALNDITLNPDIQGNGKTQTLQLETASYLLTVRISKNGLYAGVSESIHIYPLLSTVYTKEFNDDDLTTGIPPTVNDYIISGTGTFTYDGTEKTVSITPKANASPGAISGILYVDTATPPVNVGEYLVTFNVAAATGFSAVTLPAGSIIINRAAGDTVSAPSGTSSITSDSITINPVDTSANGQTVEYAINTTATAPSPTSSVWQSGTTFGDLAGGTTYYIFARSAQNTNYNSGTASSGYLVKTLITVSFDLNGGSGTTPSSQTINAGSGITLPDGSGLSRNGFTFGGWSTNSSGTESNYTAGASYTPSGNITLYARWTSTVTFNINNGSGTTPTAQIVPAGSSITFPGDSLFSRSGYIFCGWNTNNSGTGTNYNAGASYTPSGNVTFYARWVTGTEADPIPLTANLWEDGSITTSGGEVWYSFTAAANTTYRVWWNESGSDYTKTLDVRVTAYNSSGTQLFNQDYGWSTPQTITQLSGTTIKLKVTTYSSSGTGTFAIGYSTGSERSAFRIKPPVSHTPLTANQWRDGEITSSAREVWYSFTAAANTKYGVWWNDSSAGDGSKTLNVQVRAYDSNGTELFSVDNSWTFNLASTINVASGGTIYLRVLSSSGVTSGTGTFGIRYNTGFVRGDIGVTALTANQWRDGTIGVWGETWYSFNATANTTYRVWWNDSHQGNSTKNVDVRVTAYDSNGTQLFNGDYGWSTPQTITQLSVTTIYLRVTPWSGSGTGGTFAVVYSTGSTRP